MTGSAGVAGVSVAGLAGGGTVFGASTITGFGTSATGFGVDATGLGVSAAGVTVPATSVGVCAPGLSNSADGLGVSTAGFGAPATGSGGSTAGFGAATGAGRATTGVGGGVGTGADTSGAGSGRASASRMTTIWPAMCSTLNGTRSLRSMTTRATSGWRLFWAARTRATGPVAGPATLCAVARTPLRSMTRRGGSSGVGSAVAAGSAPDADNVTRVPVGVAAMSIFLRARLSCAAGCGLSTTGRGAAGETAGLRGACVAEAAPPNSTKMALRRLRTMGVPGLASVRRTRAVAVPSSARMSSTATSAIGPAARPMAPVTPAAVALRRSTSTVRGSGCAVA